MATHRRWRAGSSKGRRGPSLRRSSPLRPTAGRRCRSSPRRSWRPARPGRGSRGRECVGSGTSRGQTRGNAIPLPAGSPPTMAPMARTWDAIVVGLGGFGSAAAYWLARRSGSRILGLERFQLGHDRGASADHSRIIRLSYHRPDYVRLAKRAYATWAELEADAGVRVVTTTGGLDLFPPNAAIPEADYANSMVAEGVPFERLDAAETMRRIPAWRL